MKATQYGDEQCMHEHITCTDPNKKVGSVRATIWTRVAMAGSKLKARAAACVSEACRLASGVAMATRNTMTQQTSGPRPLRSHMIQCKTWHFTPAPAATVSIPLAALLIKGRRYSGSNTSSLDRHIKQAHDGTYVRLLDDSRYGFRRHNRHCMLSRSRRSGLYRFVLERTHGTGAALQDTGIKPTGHNPTAKRQLVHKVVMIQ
jgi:hypothetical protein